MPKKARCRHRGSWLVAGGAIEWCYACGSFRTLAHGSGNVVYPMSCWAYPTGDSPYWRLRDQSVGEMGEGQEDLSTQI